MCNTIYGYARVSSKEQNENRQMDSLLEFPVLKKNIFVDKQSGKDFKRPQWIKLIRKIRPGDVLVIHSIDRLGRNYDEILEQWRKLTRDKGIDIVILDMPLLDTRSGHDDLTGHFIADLVLQILSYVAENERTNIRKRQVEGIEAAKKRGVKFGRPRKKVPTEFETIITKWREKEMTMDEALTKCDMSRGCFHPV